MSDTGLKQTTLFDRHQDLGAKIVPFAGYEMPVQYKMGVLKEHLHCRNNAGLFDVSHMGQCFLIPKDDKFETAANALEKLVPADILGLKPGQQKYSQFLSESGGILDDLMVTRLGMDGYSHVLYLVVNAARKKHDFAHLQKYLPGNIELSIKENLSLIALQGPKAAKIVGKYLAAVKTMPFMSSLDTELAGIWCHISRSGYTGEDGYEISARHDDIKKLWDLFIAHDEVQPIGLGARDSLRLEAGLCLYGHDIDETTSPNEAGLLWSIAKHRREQGGFLGAQRVQKELKQKPVRRRVGIRPKGRAPAREGTIVQNTAGEQIGKITSGGYGPSIGGPVAMGYVRRKYAKAGTEINLVVRGKTIPAEIVKLPFVPNNFYERRVK